ncbi:hypothetical protein [Streptomyces albidoflavus]|uniref:hypothetical protein n=1 Tax=Streptomyces albidoflavus TaxID=1886 RepID=UPI00355B197D
MSCPHLPTTQAAVLAVREVAGAFHRTGEVTEEIGADRVSRAPGVAPSPWTADAEELPHEAYIELSGTPSVQVRLYADGDASVCVEGVDCPDLDRDVVPAFLAWSTAAWPTCGAGPSRPAATWSSRSPAVRNTARTSRRSN